MTLGSHEFFRGADDRHLVTQLLAHCRYSSRNLGVCQVLAVPGQQIVHSVNRGHRDVSGVRERVRRQNACGHDGLCQRFGVFRDIYGRQTADERQSFLDFRGIAKRSLINDNLGY